MSEPLRQVDIREFQDRAVRDLPGTEPIAVTQRGRVIGFYIPGATDDDDVERGKTTAARLDELYLRIACPHVFFHDSEAQREARVKGTGLAAWELVKLSREFDSDAAATAAHLEIDRELVEEALRYSHRYPQEVEDAIRESESYTLERMKEMLPQLRVFDARDSAEQS